MSTKLVRQLVVKSTVAADEHPDLYKVLAAMPDLRRRSGRLRDLATKGLLFEIGVAAGEAPRVGGRAQVEAAAAVKTPAIGGHSVDDQLNWGG